MLLWASLSLALSLCSESSPIHLSMKAFTEELGGSQCPLQTSFTSPPARVLQALIQSLTIKKRDHISMVQPQSIGLSKCQYPMTDNSTTVSLRSHVFSQWGLLLSIELNRGTHFIEAVLKVLQKIVRIEAKLHIYCDVGMLQNMSWPEISHWCSCASAQLCHQQLVPGPPSSIILQETSGLLLTNCIEHTH